MAVRVKIPNAADDVYEDGGEFNINDEHLYVRKAGLGGFAGDLLAVYAPKQWISAKVETE